MFGDDVIILGAGGFAKELCTWLRQAGVEPKGFYAHESPYKQLMGIPVYNTLEGMIGFKYYCGVGDPLLKYNMSKYAELMGVMPGQAFIHPTAHVHDSNKLHLGAIICPMTVVTINCEIGKNVIINIGCTVGHDTKIGAYTTISPGVNISGNVLINENCYIGTNASIREKLYIEKKSMIGMGAAVVKDCKENTCYTGVPARPK